MLVATLATAAALNPTVASLQRRGCALADAWGCEAVRGDDFEFDSTYVNNGERRGWANWIIRDHLMIGQYPHCQPAVPGPDAADATAHLRLVQAAGVNCFVCLQDELPSQDDDDAWPADGIQLPDPQHRQQWPAPFARYAEEANLLAAEMGRAPVSFLHCPIVDLSTPRDGLGDGATLLKLMDAMLAHYECGGGGTYVHCWGGRGRAGLVGGCFLALVRPDLDGQQILRLIQAAYDTRVGASSMAGALKRSPQTEAQRSFVRSFANAVRAARRLENDQAMVAQGMPKGFL